MASALESILRTPVRARLLAQSKSNWKPATKHGRTFGSIRNPNHSAYAPLLPRKAIAAANAAVGLCSGIRATRGGRSGGHNDRCLLLAKSGHAGPSERCPLSGVKRTSGGHASMSASDPKRKLVFCRGVEPRRSAASAPDHGCQLNR
jgi:hypothetical protein